MLPVLFGVPSTLYTLMGLESNSVAMLCRLTYFLSMKIPPAPESRRALVSMFLSVIVAGMCIEFDFSCATITFEIEIEGGTIVDLVRLIKNALPCLSGRLPVLLRGVP